MRESWGLGFPPRVLPQFVIVPASCWAWGALSYRGEMCEIDDLDDRNSNCGHAVRIRFLRNLHTNSSMDALFSIFQEYCTFSVWSQFAKKTIQWIDQHTKLLVSSETPHKFLHTNLMFAVHF